MQRFYTGRASPRPPQAILRPDRPPVALAGPSSAAPTFGAPDGAKSPSVLGDDRDAHGGRFKHWRSTRHTGCA
jgi:hypothetical protein